MVLVKCWLKWLAECVPLLTLLVLVTVCGSGCIWLALPGLAYEGYEGYKYEQHLKSPAVSDRHRRSSHARSFSRNSASTDHSIE
jgi:hypothetical protein